MLTARLPAPGASHFCNCGSCCLWNMEKKLSFTVWPPELSTWKGMLCCSKGQNEAEIGWCCPSRLFCINFSLTTLGQHWLQVGYPMLVSPLPPTSFSSSSTNMHLNIGPGIFRHTSMFPHSHCSDAKLCLAT